MKEQTDFNTHSRIRKTPGRVVMLALALLLTLAGVAAGVGILAELGRVPVAGARALTLGAGSVINAGTVKGQPQHSPLVATGTGFTYQGQLKDGGQPANGQYDFRFTLYDAPTGGNIVSTPVTIINQTVTGGLFTVILDFGSTAFDGNARYLEIAVRPTGGGAYTTLSPRQALTPTPYALFALKTQDYANVVVVAKAGGDYTSVQAALNSITANSSSNRYLVYVAPGTYTETVTMKPYVDIEGSGEDTTKITYTGSGGLDTGTVVGASNAELRSLTVENTGGNSVAAAIYNSGASPSLLHVTAVASAGGSLNYGVANFSSSPRMSNVTATASGGSNNYGVYAVGSGTITINNSTITGSTYTIFRVSNTVVIQVGASKLSGGPAVGGVTCAGVYDENYVFYPNTCP